MDYIRRSLDIVQGIIETDKNSFEHALNELKNRKQELTPLFNECALKDIRMIEICPELNNEWNEIILTLIKHESSTI
jgi:hypothetical protein